MQSGTQLPAAKNVSAPGKREMKGEKWVPERETSERERKRGGTKRERTQEKRDQLIVAKHERRHFRFTADSWRASRMKRKGMPLCKENFASLVVMTYIWSEVRHKTESYETCSVL